MFNWSLFFISIAISIPGVLFLIPAAINLYETLKQKIPAGKKIPSEKAFIVISSLQSLLLIAVAVAIGTALGQQVNLHAPFLEALSHGEFAWALLQNQLTPALAYGLGGAIFFLCAYYFLFAPRLDKQTIQCMRNFRQSAGMGTRLFYGGIVEEVLCRWGLMTLFVWIGSILYGELTSAIYWIAILLSGILFGIGHLPAYLSMGCTRSTNTIVTIITLNLFAGVIFGWLFWQYGLCAAIIAHMLFHAVWYPIDVCSTI